ncbi:unnamed protein product [Cylicocyclus nassatus]|uniref:Uncharacterized protein n=1 Tax=Cylicocyclus nassatus TaxID=53992 RepID=A0AA36M6L0_CYLNA|nr:unnamed protein product [Cylicocyclus nassatus]
MRGLYTALGVLDLVGGGIRLAADATNLGGSILSVAQMLSQPPPQLGGGADMQYPQNQQDMQLQNVQNVQDMQNTQLQNLQTQPCTATFSYYASNGNPVYQCDCPSGTSYQYLRCVNPDESGAPDVQNAPDMQQQNVQDVQEQPCTHTQSCSFAMNLFWRSFVLLTLLQSLNLCEDRSNNTDSEKDPRGGRHSRSLGGLYTALGVIDLVSSILGLSSSAAYLGGTAIEMSQLLAQQQQAANLDAQLAQQEMGNVQDVPDMGNIQNMPAQSCSATFAYRASDGNPVYLCDCPSGSSYQYLRCVDPDANAQLSQDTQQQNAQNMQTQDCTATLAYRSSNGTPVYFCDCPGYGTSYQYNRCISPKFARN